jgi:galacturan 1,4-alpha-galacturonidase
VLFAQLRLLEMLAWTTYATLTYHFSFCFSDLHISKVPAAVSAIKSCGNGGTIIFSAGKTYAIRSTLDITGCVNCQIQIEGTLKLSDDTNFWNGKRAVVFINGVSRATITTVTGSGVVDGNGVPYWEGMISSKIFLNPTFKIYF